MIPTDSLFEDREHPLEEYRCACGKLLFRASALVSTVEIKCKRCGAIRVFAGESHLGSGGVLQTHLFTTDSRGSVVTPYVSKLGQCLVIRDAPAFNQEKLLLHIEAEDYFAMLNTLLGFVLEDAPIASPKNDYDRSVREGVKAAREDLAYLHKHYRIVPK